MISTYLVRDVYFTFYWQGGKNSFYYEIFNTSIIFSTNSLNSMIEKQMFHHKTLKLLEEDKIKSQKLPNLKKTLEMLIHLGGKNINFGFGGWGNNINFFCKIYTPVP